VLFQALTMLKPKLTMQLQNFLRAGDMSVQNKSRILVEFGAEKGKYDLGPDSQ
jgi:hypothetical protein